MEAFLGVGSNVGDAAAQCGEARRRVEKAGHLEVIAASRLYRTEPVGYVAQGWFANGVLHCCTTFSPRSLLRHLQRVERGMGRERGVPRWGPRVIDLDILFYDDDTVAEPDLVIPHPRLHLRRFVLVPLADVAPRFVHPRCGRTVRELLGGLATQELVEPIADDETGGWGASDVADHQDRG